jgi:hypothetical protein
MWSGNERCYSFEPIRGNRSSSILIAMPLLIGQAADHERKDLALAQRQPFVPSAPLPLLSPCLPLGGAPGQCSPHRFEQLIPPHRLGEEIHRTLLHRMHRGGNVAMSRKKDHRQRIFGLGEQLLQLQPTAESPL